jgi:hypothetical protein
MRDAWLGMDVDVGLIVVFWRAEAFVYEDVVEEASDSFLGCFGTGFGGNLG